MKKATKIFIRKQAWLAFILSFVIIVNMICVGPMSSLFSLATGKGTIEETTTDKALEVSQSIAEEGTVLLKNNSGALPLSNTTKLNVFGWASTNSFYGGTGSGSISKLYEKVSLLDGLKNAGFETNTELVDFYTTYRSSRDTSGGGAGFVSVDWSLPEPPVKLYGDIMENAKEFSDTALIVISRMGGR